MLRRLFSALLLGAFSAATLGGCYTTGKVTGEAAQEVREGAQDFKKGYDEGRK